MIRLISAIGLWVEKGLPLVRGNFQASKKTITFAAADMLVTSQEAIPRNHRISLYSRSPLRVCSKFPMNVPIDSLYHSTGRLLNSFPIGCSQRTFGLQRRLSSSFTPQSSIDSRVPGLSRLISDPGKRRKFLFGVKLAGIALFLLVGKIVYDEARIELSLGPRPEDSEKIQEIKQFVVAFNQEKKKGITRKEFLPFQDQAFAFIDELRYIGGLAARCPFNTDLFLAKRGFLELSDCEDPKV